LLRRNVVILAQPEEGTGKTRLTICPLDYIQSNYWFTRKATDLEFYPDESSVVEVKKGYGAEQLIKTLEVAVVDWLKPRPWKRRGRL
jgi:hypothetical protein